MTPLSYPLSYFFNLHGPDKSMTSSDMTGSWKNLNATQIVWTSRYKIRIRSISLLSFCREKKNWSPFIKKSTSTLLSRIYLLKNFDYTSFSIKEYLVFEIKYRQKLRLFSTSKIHIRLIGWLFCIVRFNSVWRRTVQFIILDRTF